VKALLGALLLLLVACSNGHHASPVDDAASTTVAPTTAALAPSTTMLTPDQARSVIVSCQGAISAILGYLGDPTSDRRAILRMMVSGCSSTSAPSECLDVVKAGEALTANPTPAEI
jgi:hypothetical protein